MNQKPLYKVKKIKSNSIFSFYFKGIVEMLVFIMLFIFLANRSSIGTITFFIVFIIYMIINLILRIIKSNRNNKMTRNIYDEISFYADKLIANSNKEIRYSEIDEVKISDKYIYIIRKNKTENTCHSIKCQDVIEIEYSKETYQKMKELMNLEELMQINRRELNCQKGISSKPDIVLINSYDSWLKIAIYIVVAFMIVTLGIYLYPILSIFVLNSNKFYSMHDGTKMFFLIWILTIIIACISFKKKGKPIAYMFFKDKFVRKDVINNVVINEIRYDNIVEVSLNSPYESPAYIEIQYWQEDNRIGNINIHYVKEDNFYEINNLIKKYQEDKTIDYI